MFALLLPGTRSLDAVSTGLDLGNLNFFAQQTALKRNREAGRSRKLIEKQCTPIVKVLGTYFQSCFLENQSVEMKFKSGFNRHEEFKTSF